MKWLVVGDVHATPNELPECEQLVEHVRNVAVEQGCPHVLFLGDLYHTHAVIHVEVLAFWHRAFEKLADAGLDTYVLVGNHDMPGNEGSEAHALLAQKRLPRVYVIDSPRSEAGVAFVPYQASRERFIEEANKLGGRTLVCHQTFDGSTFENGFYAKDGLDSNLVTQEAVLSGHIHAPQSFGKVWYPGAPRWRTLSDANTDRAVWVVEFDSFGRIVGKTPFSTRGICREIAHVVETPGDVKDLECGFSSKVDWRVDIRGPSDFVDQRKRLWAQTAPGARVRTLITDATTVKVRESEGIDQAFQRFLGGFQPRHGTEAGKLQKMAQERLGWT